MKQMSRFPKSNRRQHLLAALLWILLSAAAQAQTLPNGVASGDVDQTSVILWARSTALGPITFEYTNGIDFFDSLFVESVVEDPAVPVKVEINGLAAGTQYTYRVTNSVGESLTGSFRTPFEDGIHGLRFGVTGDWRGELAPYPAISNVPARGLEFLAILGDTVYADVPSIDLPLEQAHTLEEFRRKHNEVYRERFDENFWAPARASAAFYVTLDDHEVTNDFAGGTSPASDSRFDQNAALINETELFRNGVQVFHEFNPIREERYGSTGDPRTAKKVKLYRYRRFGNDAAIFMLDARSFRDEELANILNPFAKRRIQEFVEDSFDPDRTMLGRVQFDDLVRDLSDAQRRGITWKFIMVPEPIQNLSPIAAGDRFEGYAYERTQLLHFIHETGITNVVFVTADIHSTFINNLTYQLHPDDHQRATGAFEISTGSVAYAAPFGPTVLQNAPFPRLTRLVVGFYNRLTPFRQDRFFLNTANRLLRWFGYSPIGLGGTSIDANLTAGSYIAVNDYGWSEFEIDADSQQLKVTTYGIPWYDEFDLANDPEEVVSRVPVIISQFEVEPVFEDESAFDRQLRRPSPCGALGSVGLLWPMGLLMFCLFRPRARTRLIQR
jgi:alkaline phosphatase D